MYQFSSDEQKAAFQAALANEAQQHISGRLFSANGTEIPTNSYTIVDTPTIDSRCLENEEIFNIAEMYVGELSMRIENSSIRAVSLIGGEVRLSFGVTTTLGVITIPLGVWDISDAKRESEHYISITGNDHMGRLSTPIGIEDVGIISLATILNTVHEKADVVFEQTPQQILAMAVSAVNGSCIRFEDTCWEEVRQIAQMIGGFAFANREGKIEFRTFGTEPVLTIPANKRFSVNLQEGSFGIKAIQYTEAHGRTYQAASTISHDTLSTLCLEKNKWIWQPPVSTEETYYVTVCQEILYKLAFVNILPGSVDFYGDPSLDLGDLVTLEGGVGYDSSQVNAHFLITGNYWQFRAPQTITSGGAPSIGDYVTASTSGGSGSSVVPSGSSTAKNIGIAELKPYIGALFPTARTVGRTRFSCRDFTNAFLQLTLTVVGTETGTLSAAVYLDDELQPISPQSSIYTGRYTTVSFSHNMPLQDGQHTVVVIASGVSELLEVNGYVFGQNIVVEDLEYDSEYTYTITDSEATATGYSGESVNIEIPEKLGGYPTTCVGGSFPDNVKTVYIPDGIEEIADSSATQREKTGQFPINFNSDGTSLVDWSITGAAGGAGKLGKNYLKPRTTPIPNGCEGTYLSTAFSYRDAEPGYTFNSGSATRLYITFKRPSDANIVAADTGNLMLVEGTTIPTTYDESTNLYKHGFLQGSSETHDGASNSGVSQIIFDNEDEYGRSNNYNNADGRNIRCKTYPIMLEPNTDYSVKLFNSSYTGVQMGGTFMTEPGTITPQFETLVNQKSIPGNETFVTNTEQWENLAYSHYRTKSWRSNVAIDVRPIRYEFCEYYADLKAGTYKLMYDAWGNNNMGSDWIGFQGYSGCFEDNWDHEQSNIYEWFALVADNNTQIVGKTRLFPASMDSYQNRRSKTAPFPNYYHGEVEFTLTSDTKVGLIHKAYYTAVSYAYPPFFRFYLVKSTESAEAFTTTNCSPTNISGYSAWEKYNITLPLTVSCGNQSQTISIDLNGEYLGPEDTITYTGTQVTIPTYSGTNTITVDSEIQPSEVYIKYIGTGAFMNCNDLEYVSIPESVKSIGAYAFAFTGLTSVRIADDCDYAQTSFPDGCTINRYGDDIEPNDLSSQLAALTARVEALENE